MKLLIGLGNPGKKYEKTRHNTGFMAIGEIATSFKFPVFSLQPKFNAETSEKIINGKKILLAKPQTFMNESGKSVKAIASYYKIDIKDIIIIHDDLDISLGEYKIVQNRGSAGHKGVQSIIDTLETKGLMRIRVGILPQGGKPENTENFVLENFTGQEKEIIDKVIEKVCAEVEPWIK